MKAKRFADDAQDFCSSPQCRRGRGIDAVRDPAARRADGVDRTGEYSVDGVTWNEFYRQARTTFLTADEIGFMGGANNSAGTAPFVYSVASFGVS